MDKRGGKWYYSLRMKRVYEKLLTDHFAHNRQMAFLSGPRQVGKTTLAGAVLPQARYLNYDRAEDAVLIAAGPDRIAREVGLDSPVVRQNGLVFDEIHKFSKWKTLLKGFFDAHGAGVPIAVTGSARLNVYKRGGDSLMGRYFPYRIHPLSVGELAGGALSLEAPLREPKAVDRSVLDDLLAYGGFPEPFLSASQRFCNRWRNARRDLVFHEDVRDLSRVQDIRGLSTLSELLLSRVSGGINFTNLANDLQVAPDTVKAWMDVLESLYDVFTVRPWHANVANAIRKQPKAYAWDWGSVAEGGMRAENLVASHLLKSVQGWTDSGLGEYGLYYVRDKQQREVDFLIVRDRTPWMLVECKSSRLEPLSPALVHFQKALSVPHAFQIGLDGPFENVDPFAYAGEPIRLSAVDLLSRLV